MTTDKPCNTKKRCFSFASVAALIAGMRICRVGIVLKAMSAMILALNKLLVSASTAARAEMRNTKI